GFSPVQNLSESLGHPQSNGEILKGNSLFGTGNALKLAFSGFSTSALALVAAALFLATAMRSEEHTSELQSRFDLVCRLLLEKKKIRPVSFYVLTVWYSISYLNHIHRIRR